MKKKASRGIKFVRGAHLFALELELDVEQQDSRVVEGLGLLLEPGVAEGLLESHTLHQEAVRHATAADLLDADLRKGLDKTTRIQGDNTCSVTAEHLYVSGIETQLSDRRLVFVGGSLSTRRGLSTRCEENGKREPAGGHGWTQDHADHSSRSSNSNTNTNTHNNTNNITNSSNSSSRTESSSKSYVILPLAAVAARPFSEHNRPRLTRLRASSCWSRLETASTTIGAKRSFCEEMSFEFNAVPAHLTSTSLAWKSTKAWGAEGKRYGMLSATGATEGEQTMNR